MLTGQLELRCRFGERALSRRQAGNSILFERNRDPQWLYRFSALELSRGGLAATLWGALPRTALSEALIRFR
jgi:hypothetical protein